MKKTIIVIIIILIIAILGVGIYFYMQNLQKSENTNNEVTVNLSSNEETNLQVNNSNNEKQENIISNGDIEVGTNEQRGFIIDNVFQSEEQGDIHFASYYPEGYSSDKQYAIYFALPGWEGLYFQGVGANMGEPFPYEAQKYNSDMIIISPQLDDWGEESADDTIALVEYFLNNYNIDKSKVYISGASGGGETLSIVLGKRPELFTSALFLSSQWDGDLEVLANARTPLYIAIGENDSYYGSEKAKNAYQELHRIYENQGLSNEQIDNILVLDVKEHEYFTSQGMQDEHAGLGLFAYDENIMNWFFSKIK